ncbi:MAG: 50S ribosomal protein L13 [Candidatus Nealsonbacteria bacterium]|nr:50S ribosomal protein L13 [Candidatus Nealsonbacteria bacterium]
MQRKTHTIDAAGRILGRLAVEISLLLRGKNKPDFAPYKDGGDFVTVKNVEKMLISGKKMEQKKYYRYSGYSSGLKETSLKVMFKKKPGEVLRTAVSGMMPKNKLRAMQIKRLKFE